MSSSLYGTRGTDRAKFGILFGGDDPLSSWIEYIEPADQSGFSVYGVGDSPSIMPEVYVRSTVAVLRSQRMRIGPWVTNPLLRHPAVTASAIGSLGQLSEDRVFLGIGTGDSAVANLGLHPATLSHLERYIVTVRELLTTGSSSWEGASIRLDIGQAPVPILVAASGPKTLRLAGRVADGVIVGTGVEPRVVDHALSAISEGAVSAGRSLDDLEIWWLVMSNLDDDEGTALNEIKNSLATYANLAFRTGIGGKDVPSHLVAPIQELRARYRAIEHGKFGPSHHRTLVDTLGLTEFLRQRFAICGDPDTFRSAVQRAHKAGAKNLWLSVRAPDKHKFLRLWNARIRDRLIDFP